jgi:hypothetical protein
LRANLKEKVHAINEKAFDLGISLASEREGKPLA